MDHRLSACDGWTFENGVLTLPNTGGSAVWLITFGGYRALRLSHLEKKPLVCKKSWCRADFVREDGRIKFAFVVPRGMIVQAMPLLDRVRSLAEKTFGAVPEVYGDDDNEKISQASALIALGMVRTIDHPNVLFLRHADDTEVYVKLEMFLRGLFQPDTSR